MTVRQKARGQAFRWIATISLCLCLICVCLSSCDFRQEEDNDVWQDAHDAKIVYYEAQLQALSTQLESMEQQMYLLRQDYISQIQVLEGKLNEKTPPLDTEDDQKETPVPQPPSDNSNEEQVQLSEYTYRIENGCAIITAYKGQEQEVVVPAAVDGYTVVGLDDSVFAQSDVQRVTLPETVESIGWFTFYGCRQLTSVVLPARLGSIGYASFDGCATQLCLYVAENSYAEEFALSFGLKYQRVV